MPIEIHWILQEPTPQKAPTGIAKQSTLSASPPHIAKQCNKNTWRTKGRSMDAFHRRHSNIAECRATPKKDHCIQLPAGSCFLATARGPTCWKRIEKQKAIDMSLCFFLLFLSCFIFNFIYLFCIIYHIISHIYIYDIIYYVIMYRSTLLYIIYFTSQVDFGWEIEPYHAVPRPRNNPMFLKWKIIKKIMLKDPQELTDHMRCPHFTGKMAKRDAEKGTTFRGRSMPQSRLRNRMPCVPAR